MELPENIRRLLLSHNDEDRAIGIFLLEKLPNYKSLFSLENDENIVMLDLSHGPTRYPVTLVCSHDTYWINTSIVYMWVGSHQCPWYETSSIKMIKL